MANLQENKYQEALDRLENITKVPSIFIDGVVKELVDTFQELVDKATPKATKKPWSKCPNCGIDIEGGHDLPLDCINYCFNCGQALNKEV